MAKKTVNDRLIAINSAMEKIGREGKHAAPTSQDPADALLHEYDVATIGESYFKKRREKAKGAMLVVVSPEGNKRIDDAVQKTKLLEQGQTLVVLETQHFTMNLTTKNGATFFDDTAFINSLIRQGVAREVISKALEEGAKRRDPTMSYTIAEREQ